MEFSAQNGEGSSLPSEVPEKSEVRTQLESDSDEDSDESQERIVVLKEGDEQDFCAMDLGNKCNICLEDITRCMTCVRCKLQRVYVMKVLEFEKQKLRRAFAQKQASRLSADSCNETDNGSSTEVNPSTSADSSDQNPDGSKEVVEVEATKPLTSKEACDE